MREETLRLAKRLAITVPTALVLFWLLVGTSLFLNLSFSIKFFLDSGLTGGGHGSLIGLPLAALPFLPFFGAAVVLAKKQAARRVLAGLVAPERETLREALKGLSPPVRFLIERLPLDRIPVGQTPSVRPTLLLLATNVAWYALVVNVVPRIFR